MKNLLFISILLSIMGCSPDNSLDTNNNYMKKISVLFHILNVDNEDLLNENIQNSLNTEDIRIEFLNTNGDFIPFYAENSFDIKYGYKIEADVTPYIFAYANSSAFIINSKITGIIKWNNTDHDTIVSEIRETPNTLTYSKIWVNGELKYDMNNGLNPEILIIKKNHL